MTIIGYARVSSNGQDLELQRQALKAAGCAKIWEEKKSGARADRQQLMRLLKALESGDAVIVTRLDRLARSTRDFMNIIHQIDEAGATFRSLAETWADTTTPHGKLLLTMLAGLAEFERSLIRARTGEGRERAKARGVQFGRPPKLTAHQKREAVERFKAGEAVMEIARTFSVDRATIYRLAEASG